MAKEMDEMGKKLHFVAVDEFGHTFTPQEEWVRRSHIRKAVTRSKNARPLFERLRFVDQNELSKRKATCTQMTNLKPLGRRSTTKKVGLSESLDTADTATPSTDIGPIAKSLSILPLTSNTSSTSKGSPRLCPTITALHPFTYLAMKHVNLSLPRLDEIFKSGAFRTASEPLIDSSHVDSVLNMDAVFPNSSDDAVFFNALVYAAVQIHHGDAPSKEGLLLKGRTIQLLNAELRNLNPCLSPACLGAIMILKSVAYKFPDLEAHNTHTYGLSKAIALCTTNNINLTAAARRAIFWLDLFASMLVHSKRQFSHFALPSLTCWQREMVDTPIISSPVGFVRHRNCLPDDLLECISDTSELLSFLKLEAIANLPHHAKYHQLDTMQASIESRLAFQEKSCQLFGPVAEAVRLGVFLVCYCSWMETWNSSLIPCRLAASLTELLHSKAISITGQIHDVWADRLDLLLWNVFVVSCVTQLHQGHVQDLQVRTNELIRAAKHALLSSCTMSSRQLLMQSALKDFLCCAGWKEQRHNTKEWFELEIALK